MPVTILFPIMLLMKTKYVLFSRVGCFIDTTFFMAGKKIKEQVSFEFLEKKKLLLARFLVKTFMLPARSITLANLFAFVPACTIAIARVSLTSLRLKAKLNKTIINFIIHVSLIKQVQVLFPIEETILRSIVTYIKLRSHLSSRLFYEPRLWYIANQSGSAKETVSPKIGENIEMLVCFSLCGDTRQDSD